MSRRFSTLTVLSLCALVALALNLRSPLTAIPPVIGEIRADLGMDAPLAGALTSIPVLCFGVLTPLASLLIARIGLQSAIIVTLAGAGIGILFRPYAGAEGMIGGTLLIGAALAVGNIVSLMVIARDFPNHTGIITGLYTSALNIGTMMTGALTAPLAGLIGWRAALASWVWIAILAVLLWVWVGRRQAASSSATIRPQPVTPVAIPSCRSRIVWLLATAFLLHVTLYYTITAWLPAYLADAGGMSPTQAGLVSSAFQILALLGSFGVPLMARLLPLNRQLAVMGTLWFITPLWILAAPEHWPFWSLIGGITQGGTFVVIFTLIMRYAGTLDENRRLSSIVQGVGYSVASVGPVAAGFLHDLSGGWNAVFLPLAALALGVIVIGLMVAKTGKA